MSRANRKIRLATYLANASTSKAALGVALAGAPAASADVLFFELDQTFSITQSRQDFMTLSGSGLVPSTGATGGSFTATLSFNWVGSRLYMGFGPQSFSPYEIALRTMSNDLYAVGGGQMIGESNTGDGATAGTIYSHAQGVGSGVFYMGLQISDGSGETWYGFLAMDRVSATEIRIDHWAMESQQGEAISTPVPGIGGIAALALGASGVRRSRRRPA